MIEDEYSFRYASEILATKGATSEVSLCFQRLPLFVHPKKGKRPVVQQMLNSFVDRALAVDGGWSYHPPASEIEDSKLATDFAKKFGDCRVHVEVQFGNMARWYSDMFKFQVAYSQKVADVGISVVPLKSFANLIGENIASYERALRELKAARNSIGLPILLIGLAPKDETPWIDLSCCGVTLKQLTGKGSLENRHRVIESYLSCGRISGVHASNPSGELPRSDRIISPN